ncbi:hypothetical protein HN51_037079 [Arachis hypogaea]
MVVGWRCCESMEKDCGGRMTLLRIVKWRGAAVRGEKAMMVDGVWRYCTLWRLKLQRYFCHSVVEGKNMNRKGKMIEME